MTVEANFTDLVEATAVIRERDTTIEVLRGRVADLEKDLAGANDRVTTQSNRIGHLLEEGERLSRIARDAQSELASFKDDVREKAIDTQSNHDGHITVGELNVWLTDLGLDPVETEWEVEVTVTRRWTGTVTVSALSEDDAGDKAVAGFENDEFNCDRELSEDTGYFEVEVESVSIES